MLKSGWASRDLTPTRPVLFMGQMHVRVARTVRDPITVTAWAVEDVVFVSCDVVAISEGLRQATLAALKRLQPDVPAPNVILSATHTHESLVFDEGFYAHPGGEVMRSAECTVFAAERIAAAIAEAWRGRGPQPVARAFGHAVVGHNRYAVYADGTGAMYGKTDRPDFRAIGGYEDHGVDMLFTWDADGRLAGVVLAGSYGAAPVVCPVGPDCDRHTGMTTPLRAPNGPELAKLVAEAFHKVMANLDQLQ